MCALLLAQWFQDHTPWHLDFICLEWSPDGGMFFVVVVVFFKFSRVILMGIQGWEALFQPARSFLGETTPPRYRYTLCGQGRGIDGYAHLCRSMLWWVGKALQGGCWHSQCHWGENWTQRGRETCQSPTISKWEKWNSNSGPGFSHTSMLFLYNEIVQTRYFKPPVTWTLYYTHLTKYKNWNSERLRDLFKFNS